MNKAQIVSAIRKKKSCLCIGLDTDIERLPAHFERNTASVIQFNKAIIDATRDLCVAYKINSAFYESLGAKGWQAMEETVHYIGETHFKIADAKRGDIGNTSSQYAKAFLQNMPFDAITVAPYMGSDSILPFLDIPGKWVILLGLTSNKGSNDFQKLKTGDDFLWQEVIKKTSYYGNTENLMYVIGATQAGELKEVRKLAPDHFLLIPGVGTQGGKISDVMENGSNADCGLLINVSRAVLFASNQADFAEAARNEALQLTNEMKDYL